MILSDLFEGVDSLEGSMMSVCVVCEMRSRRDVRCVYRFSIPFYMAEHIHINFLYCSAGCWRLGGGTCAAGPRFGPSRAGLLRFSTFGHLMRLVVTSPVHCIGLLATSNLHFNFF